LDIKPLVDLTCKAIARLLKGKSPAEIRRTFNILYDFNPGDDAPPPTMRDKLRNKLHNTSIKKKNGVEKGDTTIDPNQDTRSLDYLMSFIGEDSSNKTKSSKKNKSKNKKNGKAHKRSISIDSNSDQSKLEKYGNEEIEGDSNVKQTKFIQTHRLSNSLSEIEDLDEEIIDEEIDPQLKAEQDREVEEFRKRLESIQRNESQQRVKIIIPSTELEALMKSNCILGKG